MAGPGPQERMLTWLPSLSFGTRPPWTARISCDPILPIGCSADILSHCRYQGHGQHTGHQPSPRGLHDVPVVTHRNPGQAGHPESHICPTKESHMQGSVTLPGTLVSTKHTHISSAPVINYRSLILALTMTLTLAPSPNYNPNLSSDLQPSTQSLL